MKNDETCFKKTALDYSKYVTNVNIENKLEPVNRAIDDMLTRLEEFETMLSFIQPDLKDSRDLLQSLATYKPEFDELCGKIDSTEFLLAHIRSNLDMLEGKIEECELQMGTTTVTGKVSNILTPLFKKSSDKKPAGNSSTMELFKTEEYFK